ncbi:hypothetical protein Bca52824_053826 [Brassica carinata]|uniref:Uncharacterized protein n=1 Tax=Brassica carinata TaxID=52824 RepID=A0A8X7UNK0_BRACI|nr:hypothetical protein Bca52824_053826 [Brassica carinata]
MITITKAITIEKAIYEPGADELHEGFTYEKLLNMQRRDETAQHQSEIAWGRTKHASDQRAHRSSIDINPSTSIDTRSKPITTVSERDKFNNEYLTPDEVGIFRDPDGHAKAIDGRILHVSRKDIADILQTANGAENLFVHQRNIQNTSRRKQKSSMTQLVA